jgi:dTDP-4-amino-4,6-dideoxygalactose transaminase
VGDKGVSDISNMVGHNFRLGEIECAIGIEQLKKLGGLVKSRKALAAALSEGLQGLPGLRTPVVRSDRTHVYYVYPMQLDVGQIGVTRDRLCDALNAEGVAVSRRYQNIHLLPVYQRKIAFGSKGFPWTSDICHRSVSYSRGICPNAESLNEKTYMGLGLCIYDLSIKEINSIVKAFKKVWASLATL